MELSKELNEELVLLKKYLTEWLSTNFKVIPPSSKKKHKQVEQKYQQLLLFVRQIIEKSSTNKADFYKEIIDISNPKEASRILQDLHEKQRVKIATIEALEEYGTALETTCIKWEKQHQKKLSSILEIVTQNKTIVADLKSINLFVNERLDAVEMLKKSLNSGKLPDSEKKKTQETISLIENEIAALLN